MVAPQMIGQIIGEVLKQLDENRFIVKVEILTLLCRIYLLALFY